MVSRLYTFAHSPNSKLTMLLWTVQVRLLVGTLKAVGSGALTVQDGELCLLEQESLCKHHLSLTSRDGRQLGLWLLWLNRCHVFSCSKANFGWSGHYTSTCNGTSMWTLPGSREVWFLWRQWTRSEHGWWKWLKGEVVHTCWEGYRFQWNGYPICIRPMSKIHTQLPSAVTTLCLWKLLHSGSKNIHFIRLVGQESQAG
jgi:hypothetical protein